MSVYYNENNAQAAAWLRELIKAGLIALGDVDERSIEDVTADDLRGYTQQHFFAGIGGWSYALRLAGWPDDRLVWTGSCPCQPFSSAGQADGADDPRHLWPAWFELIAECRPRTIFGEQVASVDGLAWLDLVFADLEGADYAVGPVDLCAAGVGAFHLRQRLWFVAESDSVQPEQSARERPRSREAEGGRPCSEPAGSSDARQLADADLTERQRARHARSHARTNGRHDIERSSEVGELGDTHSERENTAGGLSGGPQSERERGAWNDCDWLPCRDGKARPTQPGLQPLAHGVSGRVGLLRGAGNAIVPQVAAEVIKAYLGVSEE